MTFHGKRLAKYRYRSQVVKHPCSKCGEERDTSGRYCRLCRSAYMRQWRAQRKAFYDRITPIVTALLDAPKLVVCDISPEKLAEIGRELRDHPHSGTRRRA
jgi:hypothetical protein